MLGLGRCSAVRRAVSGAYAGWIGAVHKKIAKKDSKFNAEDKNDRKSLNFRPDLFSIVTSTLTMVTMVQYTKIVLLQHFYRTYLNHIELRDLIVKKKITIVKCAIFIATQNGELGDECKDIWHVQTQDENSGESSGRVAQTMNCSLCSS